MGPVYDVPAIFADEHIIDRGSFVTVDDPQLGPMRLVNVVPRLSDTPGRICHTGPQLGEHNAEIYGELGLDDAELQSLAAEAVI